MEKFVDFLMPNKILICGNTNPLNDLFLYNLQKCNIESIFVEFNNNNYENFINNEINKISPTHIIYYNNLYDIGTNFIFDYHLIMPLFIIKICQKNNIHFTYIGSGYIYKSNIDKNIFCESDEANNFDSNYLIAQSTFDKIINIYYDIILNIRIRYPVCFDKNDYCNILQKIYINSSICQINNSITILDDFVPEIINWIMQYKIGKINCVNSGKINATDMIMLNAKYNESKPSMLNINNNSKFIINGFDYKNILDNAKLLNLWKECPSAINSMKNKLKNYYNK
jgi:hypothetical protein